MPTRPLPPPLVALRKASCVGPAWQSCSCHRIAFHQARRFGLRRWARTIRRSTGQGHTGGDNHSSEDCSRCFRSHTESALFHKENRRSTCLAPHQELGELPEATTGHSRKGPQRGPSRSLARVMFEILMLAWDLIAADNGVIQRRATKGLHRVGEQATH